MEGFGKCLNGRKKQKKNVTVCAENGRTNVRTTGAREGGKAYPTPTSAVLSIALTPCA